MATKNGIVQYYEQGHADYFLIYFRNNDRSMNYGYWDNKAKNRIESFNRLYTRVNEKLQVKKSDHILDAGCGFGQASLWFAKNIGCQVTGITLSPTQVKDGNQIAKEQGLAKKMELKELDYTKTGLPANSFDHIYALETICHLYDKTPFYREMYRLLKPAGRLVVAEYCLEKTPIAPQEKQDLQVLLDGWALEELWSSTKHKEAMEKTGFQDIKSENYSKYTEKAAHFLYIYSLFGIPLYFMLHKLKLITDVQLKNAYACKSQWTTRQAGLWGHVLLSAQKPI